MFIFLPSQLADAAKRMCLFYSTACLKYSILMLILSHFWTEPVRKPSNPGIKRRKCHFRRVFEPSGMHDCEAVHNSLRKLPNS
jgi:hypothetical protein